MRQSRLIWGVMRWGSWGANLDPNQVLSLVEHGLAEGINTFDHADIYGDHTTEALFGKALQGRNALRDKLFLTSKCGIVIPHTGAPLIEVKHYNTTAVYIRNQVEASLRNLGTDRLDRLLIHRPDVLLDPNEVAQTMEALKGEGKVLSFGVSNFSPAELAVLNKAITLEEHQVEISPLHLNAFDDGTVTQAMEHGIPLTAWSPLSGGGLFAPATESAERTGAVLISLAERHNCDPAQVALAWILKHPARIRPIVGTAQKGRLSSYVKSESLVLTHEEWYAVWCASKGKEVA